MATSMLLLSLLPGGPRAWSLQAGSLPSQKSDKRENLREACRKIVAGEWLSILDEKVQAEGWLKAIDAKSVRTRQELEKQRVKLEDLKKKTRSGEFRPGESTERDVAAGMVLSLEGDLAANEALRGPAVARLASAESRQKTFEAKMAPTFIIRKLDTANNKNDDPRRDDAATTKNQGGRSAGYPFEVDWRSPCPKWRFQCPLPPEQAAALRRMFQDQPTTHEACIRYSSIGGG